LVLGYYNSWKYYLLKQEIEMSKIVKFITIICVALVLQFAPFVAPAAHAQGQAPSDGYNRIPLKLRPGGTLKIDFNVSKPETASKVDVTISATPLQVRTLQETMTESLMQVSILVTAPVGINLGRYTVEVSIFNGSSLRKTRLGFEVVDINADGPLVLSASYSVAPPMLFLGGNGFGTAPTVMINGKNINGAITAAQDTFITLEEQSNIKLNLKRGANEIIVSVNGLVSNTFILFLDR
jgi:hypothetical protein